MMRGILPVLFLAAVVVSVQADGVSAFSALKTAQRNSGTAQLVEVSGEHGEPQPHQWTFLFKAPSARGGVLEIVVSGNEITAVRTPLRGYTGATTQPELAPARLMFDSNAVFSVVNKQAALRKVGFHWLDYSLRADQVSGVPVWVVRIYDSMGPLVGTMRISAADGSIITPLQVEEQFRVDRAPSGPVRAVEGAVETAGNVTKSTANRVKNSVLRAVGTVQEVVTGERTIGPNDDNQ